MKIKILFFILLSATANSQSIINGSFESNIGGCNYGVADTAFNNYLPGCYEFGIANQIDIMHDSCGYGAAQDGNYFIGLGVNGGADAMSLQLDTDLTAGNSYLLNFYKRLDPAYVGSNIVIGYSADSLSPGTIVDTIAAPVTNSWTQVNVNFIPAYNARFITVQLLNGFYAWDHVDNFSINNVTDINQIADNAFSVYPNPFTGKTYLHFNSSAKGRVKIKMYNLLGAEVKPVMSNVHSSIEISRNGLPNGIYIVKIFNNDQFIKEIKLIAM